jgi:hypothetical protein
MAQTRLFDLFGDFTASWPRRLVQQDIGLVNPELPAPDPTVWLSALNAAVTVTDVRTGVQGGRATVHSRLQMPVPALSGDGWPFVLGEMPDVEFRLQALAGSDRYVELFASIGDEGVEVLLERLPLEIRLPNGLITPVGKVDFVVGEFTPGQLDDLRIVYRYNSPTSVFVHVRLHMTTDLTFSVRSAVPVSFGPCRLSELPCLAVHDLRLIPSPVIALDNPLVGQRLDEVEWLRHGVVPWIAGVPYQGQFAVRSVHLDPDAEPISDLARSLRRRLPDASETTPPTGTPSAEFVLDDVVVPFFSPYLLPVPRHVTVGIRRRVLDPTDQNEAYSFENSPIQVELFREPHFGVLVESLFFRSPADVEQDLGLAFALALIWGEAESANNALRIGLGERYTLRAGYQRDYTTEGMPGPTQNLPAGVETFLHHEIGPAILDIMAVEFGVSIGRLLDGTPAGKSFEITLDLFVSMPPSRPDSSAFRLRSLSGERIAFAMRGVGYRFGQLALEGISLPDGVVVYFGPVALVIEQFGVVAAHGASYLSFSGGIAIIPPSGFGVIAMVRDLRVKLGGGAPEAPRLTMGGFYLVLWIPPKLLIQVGGHFMDEVVAGFRRREFGLTGTVELMLESTYRLSIDVLYGSLWPVEAGADDQGFRYLMAQVMFEGSLPVGTIAVTRLRVLFARNMQPKLPPPDPASRELRYLSWYRSSDPLSVPGDRRLAAWEPKNDAIAVGVGIAVSFPATKDLEISLFVLVLAGNDERGLLIVGEVFLLKSPKPVALVAIEWDGKEERFSLLATVELTLATFMDAPPPAVAKLLRLTGSFYFSTDPTTIAVGRLADQNTWLGVRAEQQFLGSSQLLLAALCYEKVDLPEGPHGFGFVVRIQGGFPVGDIAELTMYGGAGLVVACFGTGSVDYSLTGFLETGIRIVLFKWLRFGVEARGEVRALGSDPRRTELRGELHIETPWFLPDVTFVFAKTCGALAPQSLSTASAPMKGTSALSSAPTRALPVHTVRADPDDPADAPPADPAQASAAGPARTFSLAYLQGFASAETARVSAFEADDRAQPVPTDVSLAIDFSVPVTDRIGLGPTVRPAADQRSGDMVLTYELIKMALRRRPRFGTGRAWSGVDERIELSVDFTAPGGPHLTGTLSPSVITAWWDLDVQVTGDTAAKRLLLNSAAPFEVRVSAPATDDAVLTERRDWPCCPPVMGPSVPPPPYHVHRVDFTSTPAGTEVDVTAFSRSASTLRFLSGNRVRQAQLDPAWGNGYVAAVTRPSVGALARVDLDEDAAFLRVQLVPDTSGVAVGLLARAVDGAIVAEQLVSTGGAFTEVTLIGPGAIRHVEIYAVADGEPGAGEHRPASWTGDAVVELAGMSYVALADLLHAQRAFLPCADPAYRPFMQGQGKLSFLPNHEYELALTTRVRLTHPVAGAASADVTEYAMFRTKGLPGLNAVDRTGAEVEPHVRSVYPPPRALLYREEPVTCALRETMPVAVPLNFRPQGPTQAPERTQLLRLELVTRPTVAAVAGTPMTTATPDWVVSHRSEPGPGHDWWLELSAGTKTRAVGMLSDEPAMQRLAGLVRPEVTRCDLEDPRSVIGTALVAEPPEVDGRRLWPATSTLTTSMVRAASPYIDRRAFDVTDLTALSPLTAAGVADPAGWQVSEGRLLAQPGIRRFAAFGDADWDHFTVRTEVTLSAAAGPIAAQTLAGVAVGVPAGPPSQGLLAAVVTTTAGARLELHGWTGAGADAVLAGAALPGPVQPGVSLGLELTVFDDVLRARIGDIVVEAERGAVREGHVALVAEGGAGFSNLAVGGLELYRFDAPLSRYASFEEHIGSFSGTVDTIVPDDLGPGTTTATPEQLWAATAAEVAASNAADADPARRDALLQRWLRELGLPRTQDVPGLSLTAYRMGGAARALLLENPEPLDLTGTVQLSVARIEQLPPDPEDPVELLPPVLLDKDSIPWPTQPVARPNAAQSFELPELPELPELLVSATRTADAAGLALELTPTARELLDLTYPERGLPALAARFPRLSARVPGLRARPAPTIQVVEVVGTAEDPSYIVLTGPAPATDEPGTATVRTRWTTKDPRRLRALAAADWTRAEPGDVVLLTVHGPAVVGSITSATRSNPASVAVLRDLTSRCALIVAMTADGASVVPFAPGAYTLTFGIDRPRYDTTDAADNTSHYVRTAGLTVRL